MSLYVICQQLERIVSTLGSQVSEENLNDQVDHLSEEAKNSTHKQLWKLKNSPQIDLFGRLAFNECFQTPRASLDEKAQAIDLVIQETVGSLVEKKTLIQA